MNGELHRFKAYTCDYDHDGKTWAVTISAKDWADAEARVRKLGNLRLRGEIVWVIKASPVTPCWLVRFAVGIRNWWHGGQAR